MKGTVSEPEGMDRRLRAARRFDRRRKIRKMPNAKPTIIVPYIIAATLGRGDELGPADDVGVEIEVAVSVEGGFVANAPCPVSAKDGAGCK
jgi:hypothetical protein